MFPSFHATSPKMYFVGNSEKTAGDRLKEIRRGLKLSARQAERLSDPRVNHSTIGKIENGATLWQNVQLSTIRGLARAYGRTPEQLMNEVNGTPYPDKPNIFTDQVALQNPNLRHGTRSIPKYDFVGMGPGGRDGRVIGYVDIPDTWSGEYVAFDAMGDSMGPQIPNGTTLIIRLQDSSDINEVIVCWTDEDGMLCKFLKDILDDGTHVLTSFNPAYPPIWARNVKIYGILWETRSSWRKNGKKMNGSYS